MTIIPSPLEAAEIGSSYRLEMGYDGLERSAFCPKICPRISPVRASTSLQRRAGCHYFTSDYMRITLVLNAMMERFSYLEHPNQVKLKPALAA